MKEIKRDNSIINYTVTGTGVTTLLFVHGSYIDQTYWANQVSYFSQHYKVVTLDLPGHGNSGKERKHWSVKGFAEDVHTVIKELNLKNVILIGHSLGGDINLIAATSYPENIIGFIGIDNFKNAATPLPQEYQQQVVTIQENLKTDFANTNEQYARMALLTKQTSPEITNRVIKDYRNAYQPMGLETMPEVFNMFETEKKLLPQLRLKLYLINVDYMPTNEAPLKQYAGSGYEVLHMKGSCHFPMLENSKELNELLEQTIEKVLNI
jgi:pimeloyl-ACP methyl ester carboxylesterase